MDSEPPPPTSDLTTKISVVAGYAGAALILGCLVTWALNVPIWYGVVGAAVYTAWLLVTKGMDPQPDDTPDVKS